MKAQTSATMATPMAMWIRWRMGRMIGLPLILPLSLAKAMTEPVKVKAPMAVPILISTSAWAWMAPTAPMPKASGA
ncbi:hypothetical protein D3C71_1823120 [compost metagenome]